MRVYGQCLPAGPLNVPGVPIPIDPTLNYVRPQPPRPVRTIPTRVTPRKGRTPGQPITPAIREAIRNERAEGRSLRKIGTKYGIAHTTVATICEGPR